MKLLEGLKNPKGVSIKHVGILMSIGLFDSSRNLTSLAQRLLAREQSAADELCVILRTQWPNPYPDWVTEPPLLRASKVFGPASCCGYMAAHSLGF